MEKAFRVSMKLKPGKQPHLFIAQLKEIMANDTSLHPMMNRTLKMLKKTRTPYIMLPHLREMVFDPLNFRHFDRSAEPKGNWVVTLWAPEEIKDYLSNKEEYIKTVLKLFEALGYELYDSKTVSEEYMNALAERVKPQIESQLKGRLEDDKNRS